VHLAGIIYYNKSIVYRRAPLRSSAAQTATRQQRSVVALLKCKRKTFRTFVEFQLKQKASEEWVKKRIGLQKEDINHS
jgi:hypothetical protein